MSRKPKQEKVKAKKEKVPKKYHIVKAIVAGVLSAVFNILIPVFLLNILSPDSIFNFDLSAIDMEGVKLILNNILLLSPVMVALSVLATLFRKGDIRRVVFGSIKGFFKIVWLLFITNMGHMENLFSLDQYGFSIGIVVTGLVGIMALFAVTGCIIGYCDYKDHHEEFLDDCDAIAISKGELPPERKHKGKSDDERIGGRYD